MTREEWLARSMRTFTLMRVGRGDPMTRGEWLAASEPVKMLFAEMCDRISGRKMWLFTSGYCRLACTAAGLLAAGVAEVIDLADRCADQLEDLGVVQDRVRELLRSEPFPDDRFELTNALMHLGFSDPFLAAIFMTGPQSVAWSADLLRCVVGTPFPRPAPGQRSWGKAVASVLVRLAGGTPLLPAPPEVDPFIELEIAPEWRTEAVVAIAAGIYADLAFVRLPILADALEDAGCADDEILAHCRSSGPHARGCWVVDLVLGKG